MLKFALEPNIYAVRQSVYAIDKLREQTVPHLGLSYFEDSRIESKSVDSFMQKAEQSLLIMPYV